LGVDRLTLPRRRQAIASESGRIKQSWLQLNDWCSFSFNADDKDMFALAHPRAFVGDLDAVLRLLAASVVHSVFLQKGVIMVAH
jgi:hypothetical protein